MPHGPAAHLLALALLAACGATPPSAQAPPEDPVTTHVLEGDLDGDGVAERLTAYLGRSGQRGVLAVEDDGRVTASPIYPIWSARLADLDGDGRLEIVVGAWSRTPRHAEPDPHRTVWVLAWRDGSLDALWRASALARPLRDVTTADLDGDGVSEVLALEEVDAGCVLAAYRWRGFGVVGLAHLPLPCDGLSLADGLGHDGALVETRSGRRSVRLERQEIVLDATP